jgi:hypothetical protein
MRFSHLPVDLVLKNVDLALVTGFQSLESLVPVSEHFWTAGTGRHA